MRSFPFIQTSVFTDDKYTFSGNQLATFWSYEHNSSLTPEEMLGITREMNFSETTFAFPPEHPECISKVRIFTPGSEIPFAGHPTLGTAFVLQHKNIVDTQSKNEILELGIGPTPVEYIKHNLIRMTQQAPEFLTFFDDRLMIAKALAVDDADISKDIPAHHVSTGSPVLIVRLNSLSAIQKATPNPVLISQLLENEPSDALAILCTETMHGNSDVHVRLFAPDLGVLEDPATGSVAGPIGAYIEHHDIVKGHTPRSPLLIEQGYEMNRPSLLQVEVVGRNEMEKVLVSGKVRLIAEGQFFL